MDLDVHFKGPFRPVRLLSCYLDGAFMSLDVLGRRCLEQKAHEQGPGAWAYGFPTQPVIRSKLEDVYLMRHVQEVLQTNRGRFVQKASHSLLSCLSSKVTARASFSPCWFSSSPLLLRGQSMHSRNITCETIDGSMSVTRVFKYFKPEQAGANGNCNP